MADQEHSDHENDRTKKHEAGKITRAIKVALVGDGTVGKTCLLMSYICQAFTQDYIPTMFDNFSAIEKFDDELVNVILWDTAGQEDYETIRVTTCFPNTHVFILCFSVVHPDSFHNIKQKWLEELKRACPDTPYILVGTKTDLREDTEQIKKLAEKGKEPISFKMGTKRAKEIKARCYVECNAKELNTVNEVFQKAIEVVMEPLREKKEASGQVGQERNRGGEEIGKEAEEVGREREEKARTKRSN